MRKRSLLLVGYIAIAVLAGSAASGHGRSVSYSTWTLDDMGAEISLRLKLLELSRLGPGAIPPGSLPGGADNGAPDRPGRAFPNELVLLADGEPCAIPASAKRRPDEPGWVRYQWRVECPENAEKLVIQSRILLDVAPSHLHFARVRSIDGSEVSRERVLTEAAPQWILRQPAAEGSQAAVGSEFSDYIRLGIEHILSGWDHLAFVFGLLLLANRLGEVARLITGFTLAHSLTLALAVLDWMHPNALAVEAVIAFSVALVAIEKGWLSSGRNPIVPGSVVAGLLGLAIAGWLGASALPFLTVIGLILFTACYFALATKIQTGWTRICLTFAFGLIHGFGFAGILIEMSLPSDRLVPALLGFNIGVEIGQLGIVVIVWPMLILGKRIASSKVQRWGAELSTAALCGLGVYWLVERAFGA